MNNKLYSIKRTIGKYSPEILTGIGVASYFSGIVSAIKATPLAIDRIQKKKIEEEKDILEPIEVIKETWNLYLPAFAWCVVGTGCVLAATYSNSTKQLAMAAVQAASQEVIDDLQERVKEKTKEVISGDRKEEADTEKPVSEKDEEKGYLGELSKLSPEDLFRMYVDAEIEDVAFNKKFTCRINDFDAAVNNFNRKLMSENFKSVNELYSEIDDYVGIGTVGDLIGWDMKDGFIEVEYSEAWVENGKLHLKIFFDRMPNYQYV